MTDILPPAHAHIRTHTHTHTHTHTTVDQKYILVLSPVGTAESESVGEEMLLLKKEGMQTAMLTSVLRNHLKTHDYNYIQYPTMFK